jgi:hypothetical protein
VLLGLLAPTACGGGAPLLYPARTLGTGDVRLSGGTSGSFVVGSLANDVSAATIPGPRAAPRSLATEAKAAVVLAAVAPGMAPYVAGRVGVGDRFEAGLTYTGRAGHLDVRRSFDSGDVSVSVGLGLEVPIYGDSYAGTLSFVDLASIRGYGGDIPVLVGWQSAARAYMVWAGGRAGWDHTSIGSGAGGPGAGSLEPDISLGADRFYGGGVVGLAAGFRHVHVALELDAAYQTVSGQWGGTGVTVQGFSVAPAAALWWTF